MRRGNERGKWDGRRCKDLYLMGGCQWVGQKLLKASILLVKMGGGLLVYQSHC